VHPHVLHLIVVFTFNLFILSFVRVWVFVVCIINHNILVRYVKLFIILF
jgi:hypothetical protein